MEVEDITETPVSTKETTQFSNQQDYVLMIIMAVRISDHLKKTVFDLKSAWWSRPHT
jgi:hypothetical protein